MKGGFYGLRGKQISLTLIAFMCTIILIWAWDKTHLLTTLLPPQMQLLTLSPDILMGAPVAVVSSVSTKSDIDFKEDLSHAVPEEEKPIEQKGKNSATPTDFTSPENSKTDNPNPPEKSKTKNKTIALVEQKENLLESSKEQAKSNEETKGKKMSEYTEKHSDAGTAVSSASTTSYSKEKDANSTLTLVGKKDCNYAKGKWVKDSKRPLYSGFGCKQWLSEMWACRLTQRTDFAYENFRWQPNNCDMPEFEGSSILRRMQDKTIAIIGDSLGRQQFQSLMCMLTGGKERSDVMDVGWEYGLVIPPGSQRPDGWAYHFPSTNTTILYYWSASLCHLEPIDIKNPATDWAMHLDQPPAFLARYLHRFDVLVLNTGHHWNRGKMQANRWVMYVGGVPNTDRKLAQIGNAKSFTVYSIVKWVDSQLPKHPKLKAFLRTLSPRHFFNGDWNSGGTCDKTTPLEERMEVVQDESSDPTASGAVKDTQVKLLDITAISQLRDEGHISRYSIKATPGVQDCLHWCLPGIPDTWNEILLSQV